MKRSHKQRRADKLATPPPARPAPAAPDPRKVHYYGLHLDEMVREAERLDRSVSWVVQRAWRIARDRVRAMPISHRAAPPDPPPVAAPTLTVQPSSRKVSTRRKPQPDAIGPEPTDIRQRRLAKEWAAHLEATRGDSAR